MSPAHRTLTKKKKIMRKLVQSFVTGRYKSAQMTQNSDIKDN
jgi:hypothetical protein